jgi:preprotein translocase subunit SecA
MIGSALTKIFGSKNERVLKPIQLIVDKINSFEPDIQKLDDAGLAAKTVELRERVASGESLDDLLPEAFAATREAAYRVIGERHYDVQLVGGVILHQGNIAEMKTGEGKTLCSTLAVYLNALSGKGVHVVTVNDYLASRDSEWMGAIYRFLGLTTGTIVHAMSDEERQEAYNADVTYGTNNEFGFDYLRDNMKFDIKDYCQRDFNFAIVDEVDSILVDEARTPLIISGPADISTELYHSVDKLIPRFKKDEHYSLDEKARTVSLTEEGVTLGEQLLKVENLYDPKNIEYLHHLNQGLKAHLLFQNDVDYLVKDGEVVIVDEFTGRTMPGRRYSDGLHQALEAKEGVKVEQENQTLASITFQNYFRLYEKLAGMTGTADTEAAEFKKIYNLDVVIIPTHKNMIRDDFPDFIYKNIPAKYKAVVREIEELHKKGQPVLVGTISIDVSEKISNLLKKKGVKHSVLNAKHHEKEAEIIAEAGQKGRVTIATNMAGRGTDIKLGKGVPDIGGLHILGTSRHESRRIDNQLRGRSGRQGDQGSSRFYLSLEDDLLRIFGSDRISGVLDKLGMDEDDPIEHNMISRAIENAQRKVEGHNFDIRKHLLEYDDVMYKLREVIYQQRREALDSKDIKPVIEDLLAEEMDSIAAEFVEQKILSEDWDWQGINEVLQGIIGVAPEWDEADKQDLDHDRFVDKLKQIAQRAYKEQEETIGVEGMRYLERVIFLQMVDTYWKEHLLNMDHLKEGIGLRGYGQKNPLNEYKREGFEMFAIMIETVKQKTLSTLFKIKIASEEEVDREALEKRKRQQSEMRLSRGGEGSGEAQKQPMKREGEKIGRNAPCPCGSGKKYKKCHGRLK